MTKLFKTLAVVTALSVAASSALASEGRGRSMEYARTEKVQADFAVGKYYLKGLVGWGFAQNFKITADDVEYVAKNKNSFRFGAGVGYEVVENFRLELDLIYTLSHKYKYEGAESHAGLSLLTPMVKAHYDFVNSNGFTPFVSAGLGGTYMRADNPAGHAEEGKFAFSWGAGAGVGYEISKNVIAELSYFYTDYSRQKFEDGDKASLTGHSLNLGVRFKL